MKNHNINNSSRNNISISDTNKSMNQNKENDSKIIRNLLGKTSENDLSNMNNANFENENSAMKDIEILNNMTNKMNTNQRPLKKVNNKRIKPQEEIMKSKDNKSKEMEIFKKIFEKKIAFDK